MRECLLSADPENFVFHSRETVRGWQKRLWSRVQWIPKPDLQQPCRQPQCSNQDTNEWMGEWKVEEKKKLFTNKIPLTLTLSFTSVSKWLIGWLDNHSSPTVVISALAPCSRLCSCSAPEYDNTCPRHRQYFFNMPRSSTNGQKERIIYMKNYFGLEYCTREHEMRSLPRFDGL